MAYDFVQHYNYIFPLLQNAHIFFAPPLPAKQKRKKKEKIRNILYVKTRFGEGETRMKETEK